MATDFLDSLELFYTDHARQRCRERGFRQFAELPATARFVEWTGNARGLIAIFDMGDHRLLLGEGGSVVTVVPPRRSYGRQ